MTKIVGIRFRTAGKIYYFDPADFDLDMAMHVIVETARGIEMGTVLIPPKEVAAALAIRVSHFMIRWFHRLSLSSEWQPTRMRKRLREIRKRKKRHLPSARRKSSSTDLR